MTRKTNETDPRFPSGLWTGFFVQGLISGLPVKHSGWQATDLQLAFVGGRISGRGRDWVGNFVVSGVYETDGSCQWEKAYVGQHVVLYRGLNEGKGIWGTWMIEDVPGHQQLRGSFYIWPEGMPEPS